MAVITNYTTLQTAVTDYLARADITSANFVPNFIQNWEERFYRDSKNWASWMEASLSVTISTNAAAVPADYLGLKVAYIGTSPLKRVTLTQLYERYPRGIGSAGTAKLIARDRTSFVFGPEGVSGTLSGTYYAKPTVLRSDGDGVNWLITNAPDLCLYGALLEAQPFIKDPNWIDTWQRFYNEALLAYRSQFKEEEYLNPFTVVV